MSWEVNGTFTIEYETPSEKWANVAMGAMAAAEPDKEFYIMELVNPKQDKSNLFNVCCRMWRAA